MRCPAFVAPQNNGWIRTALDLLPGLPARVWRQGAEQMNDGDGMDAG
jgi:hypothetical protein